jgi:ribosomal protein L7Ae-like RNA K-turn-binding protein
MDKQPNGKSAGDKSPRDKSPDAPAGEKAAARLFGMIGLARRAGRITFGFDAVLEDIAAGRAKAVLVTHDASDRTARKMKEACARRHLTIVTMPLSKAECGNAAGRVDTAVIAVSDASFADKMVGLVGTETSLTGSQNTAEGESSERTDTGGGL